MGNVLIINAAGRETRVALVENGHIAELYLERKKDKGIVGNIYKGKVTRVLPGMQAAFVDIGLDKAAFLYVDDVLFDPNITRHQFDLTEGESEEESSEAPEAEEAGNTSEAISKLVDVQDGAAEQVAQEIDSGSVTASSDADLVASTQDMPSNAGSGTSNAIGSEARSIQASRQMSLKDVKKQELQKKEARIEELLQVGQEVLVQVSKAPIGTKGARVTSHISIPGRHLVFLPTVSHVGISRRIVSEKERRRLREIVDCNCPENTGFIVRTVAENVPRLKLEADIRFLIGVWNDTVRKSAEYGDQSGLLHPDLDLILRATRDLFAQDVEELIIDDRSEWERVHRFVSAQDQTLADRVVLHANEEPIFDAYGIEEEIKRASGRKVWLKSGGYLIIDQAEALTAIDVNSGRYVGQQNPDDTILKINVEAAKEVVYQLRLRNIGGIIICDFIDMEKQEHRDKVFKALHEALGRDKAKTNVLRISELGLLEMTRKRVRESIGQVLHEVCGYCNGQGYIKTSTTVAYEIFSELRRSGLTRKEPTFIVQCHTEVANILQSAERTELRHLMDRYNKTIQIRARHEFHREQYEIHVRPANGDEVLVLSTQTQYDSHAYSGARKPSNNGTRFERGGGRGRNRNKRSSGNRQRSATSARVST